MKRMSELKTKMVNVKNDLWYEIADYMTDAEGFITMVKGDNGTWYDVKKIEGLQ